MNSWYVETNVVLVRVLQMAVHTYIISFPQPKKRGGGLTPRLLLGVDGIAASGGCRPRPVTTQKRHRATAL